MSLIISCSNLAVRDSTGEQVFSSALTIQSSDDSSCLNGGSSSSGTGTATGTATTPAGTTYVSNFLEYISIRAYTLLVALLPLAVALLLLVRPLLLRLLVLLRGLLPLVPPPAQVLRLVLALNSRTTQLFVHL